MAAGFWKTVLKEGNGQDVPEKGDKVMIAYTGWLRDSKNEEDFEKGTEYIYLVSKSIGLS